APHHPDYWVYDYPDWDELHAAVLQLVEEIPVAQWSEQQLAATLYAINFNDEHLYLAREIRLRRSEALISLTEAAAERMGESVAKWQLAEQLGLLPDGGPRAERVLLTLSQDKDE